MYIRAAPVPAAVTRETDYPDIRGQRHSKSRGSQKMTKEYCKENPILKKELKTSSNNGPTVGRGNRLFYQWPTIYNSLSVIMSVVHTVDWYLQPCLWLCGLLQASRSRVGVSISTLQVWDDCPVAILMVLARFLLVSFHVVLSSGSSATSMCFMQELPLSCGLAIYNRHRRMYLLKCYDNSYRQQRTSIKFIKILWERTYLEGLPNIEANISCSIS